MIVKKWLSYLIPINIKQEQSVYSKNLEVTWSNGQLVLDSANANYSYGSLQRILRIGLHEIGFDQIQNMQHIIVLGVAGGSVIKTLVNEIDYQNKITGVEIDAGVIQLAKQYFGLDSIANFKLILADAHDFVLQTKERCNLLIIDIFQDTAMPDFLFEKQFIHRIWEILETDGFILFNTMCFSEADFARNKMFLQFFTEYPATTRTISRVEKFNEIILIQKLRNNAAAD